MRGIVPSPSLAFNDSSRKEMNNCLLDLWWGAPESAAAYRTDALTVEQAVQAARREGRRAQLDWQVSRALIQAQAGGAARISASSAGTPRGLSAGPLQSLSHRAGHALFVHGGPVRKLGADLETMRPRDIIALAAWTCTEAERAALARASEFARSRIFYTLWTLKEAFLKASGGDFPADMRQAGLWFPASFESGNSEAFSDCLSGCRLRPPDSGTWRGVTYGVGTDWVASVVWQPILEEMPAALRWRPGPHAVLPATQIWGDWRL
jgi:4'-phosphopantetheinyl transferase